jgi:hypothetical protein
VPTGSLDSIVQTILKPAEGQDGNLLAVIAGAPSKTVSSDAALNLAELQSLQQTSTYQDTTPGIMKYLLPNALIGILFMLFIVFILIFGFLCLMEVQTPQFFPSEGIDFGKIEK